jgi:hypothetical protein
MATPFKDLGKAAKDLLTKNYPDPKNVGNNLALGLSSKLKATEYVTVTTEAAKHPNGDDVSGSVETVFDCPEQKSKITLKLDTAQKYDVTFERRELVDGVTVELGGSFSEDSTVGKFNVGYKNDKVNGGVEVTYALGAKAPKVIPRFAATHDKFQVGGTAEVDLNQEGANMCKVYSGLASYNDKKHIGSLYYNSKDKVTGASYYQKYSNDIELGGDVSFKQLDFSAPYITLGGSYKPRSTSTFKARLQADTSKNVRGGFAIEDQFHHFKLQLGYDINLIQFSGQVSQGKYALNDQVGHQFAAKLILD